MTDSQTDEQEQDVRLNRSLSMPLAVFYGLGNILGAGIYVLVGKVAGIAGPWTPVAFLLSSLVVAATALTYAEMVGRFPRSAGEAVYVEHGLGWRPLSVGVGLLISLAGIVSSAAIAKGFVGYLRVFLPVDEASTIILLVLLLGVLAIWGIRQSVWVATGITILEIAGLLMVIGVGIEYAVTADGPVVRNSLPPMELPSLPMALAIGYGAFLAFYAFLGFEDMVNIAEEVRQPRQKLPLAIVITLVVATVLYTAVSWVAVTIVDPNSLANSEAPLVEVIHQATGLEGNLIAIIGLFAVVNGALVQMIMVSRVLYGMSAQGWLPAVLGRVNPQTQTPVISTVLVIGSIIAFALWLPIVQLAAVTSLSVLLVFILVNLSLVVLKLKGPKIEMRLQFPVWVPVLGVLTSIALAAVGLLYSE